MAVLRRNEANTYAVHANFWCWARIRNQASSRQTSYCERDMWFEERLVSSIAHHARHACASKPILKPMSFIGFDHAVQKEACDLVWRATEQLVREKNQELERQAQAFVN